MPQKKEDLLEKVPGLDLPGGFWTNLCAVVELGVKLFFCGGISQKLVCILCRLKRYNLIQHEDWGEKGILRFSLAISVKNISSRKRLKDSLRRKRNLPLTNSTAFTPNNHHPTAVCTAVSYVEIEVSSACDIFA